MLSVSSCSVGLPLVRDVMTPAISLTATDQRMDWLQGEMMLTWVLHLWNPATSLKLFRSIEGAARRSCGGDRRNDG